MKNPRLARLIYSMFLSQASTIAAVIDHTKHSLRACKRLREVEHFLSVLDAYNALCSVTLIWPFKADTYMKIATLRHMIWQMNLDKDVLQEMLHHEKETGKPANRSTVRLTNKGFVDRFITACNTGWYMVRDRLGYTYGNNIAKARDRYIRAEKTAYTGDRFEKVFKEAAHTVLAR